MTIEILPARLANQIAAGEVVERPASVVKELVENSLDAGANRITIEIQRGGHKLIRISDNGAGIPEGQLTLALSRHATSKLKSLDDLENICSLGFRGEALASISSVSRLTLTSKTAEQAQAWQAYAEGRDMEVVIKPAAHPQGTTIEVADLFFNTPARRKFLRTEKTEFSHIDELIRRIALSRMDVSFSLKHNNKTVRNYRAITAENQIQRIAAVAGKQFAEQALYLQSGDEQLHIDGWMSPIHGIKDPQYTYVNGRMMRDKLILHAIRQAFEETLPGADLAGFILFIKLSPRQVDVNVHPAKHEVRFHQARLVHDFILQAVKQVISVQTSSIVAEPNVEKEVSATIAPYPATEIPKSALKSDHTSKDFNYSARQSFSDSRPFSTGKNQRFSPEIVGKTSKSEQFAATQQFYQPVASEERDIEQEKSRSADQSHLGFGWQLLNDDKVFFVEKGEIKLASLKSLLLPFWQQQIEKSGELVGKTLLLPVRVSVDKQDQEMFEKAQSWLSILGFNLNAHHQFIIVKQLPMCLYHFDVNSLVDELVPALALESIEQWLNWLHSLVAKLGVSESLLKQLCQFVDNSEQAHCTLLEKSVTIDLSQAVSSLETTLNHAH